MRISSSSCSRLASIVSSSPSDRLDQAKRIYKTYLDPKSEARIVCPQLECERVKSTFETAMNTGSDLPVVLFDKLYHDAVNTLSMDVFPVTGGGAPGRCY